MNAWQILGLVVLVVGIVLLVMGINASQAVGEEVREGLTGRFSSTVQWYIILGIAAIVGGGLLAIFGNRIGTHGTHTTHRDDGRHLHA